MTLYPHQQHMVAALDAITPGDRIFLPLGRASMIRRDYLATIPAAVLRQHRLANTPETAAFYDQLAVTMRYRLRDMLDVATPWGPPKWRAASPALLAYYDRKHNALCAHYEGRR